MYRAPYQSAKEVGGGGGGGGALLSVSKINYERSPMACLHQPIAKIC